MRECGIGESEVLIDVANVVRAFSALLGRPLRRLGVDWRGGAARGRWLLRVVVAVQVEVDRVVIPFSVR
jgi:hypothetical protein